MKSSALQMRPAIVVALVAAVAIGGYTMFRAAPALREARDGEAEFTETSDAVAARLAAARVAIDVLTPAVEALRNHRSEPPDSGMHAASGPAPELARWAKEAGLVVASISLAAPASKVAPTVARDPDDVAAPKSIGVGRQLVADGRFGAVRAFVRRLASDANDVDVVRLEIERRPDGSGVRMTLGLAQ